MKILEKLGLDKNAIILLSSDNGTVVDDGYRNQAAELLGNHKPAGIYCGGKYSSFEGRTLISGIERWKYITSGKGWPMTSILTLNMGLLCKTSCTICRLIGEKKITW